LQRLGGCYPQPGPQHRLAVQIKTGLVNLGHRRGADIFHDYSVKVMLQCIQYGGEDTKIGRDASNGQRVEA